MTTIDPGADLIRTVADMDMIDAFFARESSHRVLLNAEDDAAWSVPRFASNAAELHRIAVGVDSARAIHDAARTAYAEIIRGVPESHLTALGLPAHVRDA